MGGSINDQRLQLAALRDMGAVPPDTDLEALASDLGLDKPIVDPITLAPEDLLAEVRDLTKRLLEYGARFPKILMLFVKDLLFVDGSLATLAPDLDLFSEVQEIAAYFTSRYGERIAHDIGIDPRLHPIDMNGVRAAVGVGEDVEALTYRDLQARRELIRRRMEEHRRRAERPTRRPGPGPTEPRWRPPTRDGRMNRAGPANGYPGEWRALVSRPDGLSSAPALAPTEHEENATR